MVMTRLVKELKGNKKKKNSWRGKITVKVESKGSQWHGQLMQMEEIYCQKKLIIWSKEETGKVPRR
jgi:hypothetical protein